MKKLKKPLSKFIYSKAKCRTVPANLSVAKKGRQVKIVLDQVTKEFEIIEKKKFLSKNWLIDNKIYFETIMMIALTLMGIIISFTSVLIQRQANYIQEQQLALSEQTNLPFFNVSQIVEPSDYEIDGVTYPAGIIFNIVNSGGNLSEGYLHASERLEVLLKNYDKDLEFSIGIEDDQRFIKSYSYYDAQTNSFMIKCNFDNRNIRLRYFLTEMLINEYKEYDVYIFLRDYVNIQYYDFRGNFHNDWYDLEGGSLEKRSPLQTDKQKFLQLESLSDEEIYAEVKNMLDNLIIKVTPRNITDRSDTSQRNTKKCG